MQIRGARLAAVFIGSFGNSGVARRRRWRGVPPRSSECRRNGRSISSEAVLPSRVGVPRVGGQRDPKTPGRSTKAVELRSASLCEPIERCLPVPKTL
jgi:hypothetical protein